MNHDSDIEEVLLSTEQINEKCQELGKRITADYKGKYPILVGLLKGCVPFMAELMKYLDMDMEIDCMDVSSYKGTESSGHLVIEKDLTSDVFDRHIIIVDDIIDTGLTLKEVQVLLQDRGAASVEIVTLLDKPEGRKTFEVVPKYIGYTIPKKFVVGFGLDYNQQYRNLSYIGILKESVYKK